MLSSSLKKTNFFLLCGKFGSPYMGKAQQLQEQRYPFLSVCAVFPCVQTMIWLPVFGFFNVRTDGDACDCTRGLYGHRKRVCTESWLWEKNPLPGFPAGRSTNWAIPALIKCVAYFHFIIMSVIASWSLSYYQEFCLAHFRLRSTFNFIFLSNHPKKWNIGRHEQWNSFTTFVESHFTLVCFWLLI